MLPDPLEALPDKWRSKAAPMGRGRQRVLIECADDLQAALDAAPDGLVLGHCDCAGYDDVHLVRRDKVTAAPATEPVCEGSGLWIKGDLRRTKKLRADCPKCGRNVKLNQTRLIRQHQPAESEPPDA